LEAILHKITEIAPPKRDVFNDRGDLDIAYQDDDLPRFRVNAFRQRGAISFAFRVIPKTIPTFEMLSLPKGVRRLADEHRGLVLSTMHTVDAAETIGRMIEFFPGVKQPMNRSIMAGVLRGVISQRLLPRIEGGRVAAVEVMVMNTRIADLIRESETESIPDAI